MTALTEPDLDEATKTPGTGDAQKGRFPTTLVAGSSSHRIYRFVGWALFILVVLLVPFIVATPVVFNLGTSSFTIGMDNLNHAVAWMVAVLGINVLVGYAGQISLGNSFFVGLGAYLSAWLIADQDWSPFLTPIVVLPVCFLIGLVVGIPALRISGLYLALVTLALAAVFPSLVKLQQFEDETGGANGKVVDPGFESPIDFEPIGDFLDDLPAIGDWFSGIGERQERAIWMYFLVAAVTALSFWAVSNMRRSRFGRALLAMRDNPTGAAVSGVNLAWQKTAAFGVSAVLCGLAGIMFTTAIGSLSPDTFSINLAIFFIVGLVVGGVAQTWGPVVGGLVIIFVPHLSSQLSSVNGYELSGDRPYGTLVLGLLLIALTFVLPGGIVDGFRRLRARFVRVVRVPPAEVQAATGSPARH